jgi:hypothetical protein
VQRSGGASSLSQQGPVWRGALGGKVSTATLLACQAGSLFYVYDSLIEKCSTLSRLCFSTGVECLFLFKPSVGTE